MSNKDICTKLQELIDAITDTELAQYIPVVDAAKDKLVVKSSNKKPDQLSGQLSMEDFILP